MLEAPQALVSAKLSLFVQLRGMVIVPSMEKWPAGPHSKDGKYVSNLEL